MIYMKPIERVTNFLYRKPVDRIPIYEHFWNDTQKEWAEKGWIAEDVDFAQHFNFDMKEYWPFNMTADIDFVPQVIEETEDSCLILDGNGAKLRRHKKHEATPEHFDFTVKERMKWEEMIRPRLLSVDERRIDFDGYRKEKDLAAKENRFFCWSGINVFELIHPVCGHEHMLVGMAMDPAWVKDMCSVYSDLTISLMEILFSREGYPDGLWFYEDMGFKERPFMSPAMYSEIVQPAHKKTIDYAHSKGLPVIMHSCGFVEPLLPGMIEAGIDCLQVIEVKAGMDLKRIYDNYGEVLSLMGGMDIRELYSNDKERINHELENKLPYVMGHNGYALHSDHSIPSTVDIDTYKYFIERGLELGKYN